MTAGSETTLWTYIHLRDVLNQMLTSKMTFVKDHARSEAFLNIQFHLNVVSSPGAGGGREFWLAGGGSILGDMALPDAVVAAATCPQDQWPDNRGKGGWVWRYCLSDWESVKAIKSSLRWLSVSLGNLQSEFLSKVCVCV